MKRRRMRAIVVAVMTAIVAASCGSETTTSASNDAPFICETQLDEIVSLFQSGLPTYDYDPFPSTTSLLEGSELVAFGVIDSLSRKTVAEDGLTIAAVSNVEIVHPANPAREVESVGWSSWWADSSNADPLAEVVAIEALEFVAFLTSYSPAPGGLTPHIQGLSVSCAGSTDHATPIQASLPGDASGKSLDELREFVGTLATKDAAAAGDPLDGPLMRHPVRSETDEGQDAEVGGVLQVEGDCLYLGGDSPAIRFPVIWPAGTRWDAERQVVTTPNGDQIGLTDEAYGSGGYSYLDSVKTLLGRDAAALTERCLDNEFGEVAIVNNHDDAIGRR